MKATLLLAASLLAVFAAEAATTVRVLPGDFGAWEGWGVSLCWWANVYGESAELAALAFSLADNVSIPGISTPLPGLGMTIARFNAGATSNRTINGSTHINLSPNMPAWKQLAAFQLDWYSNDPTSASWDWSTAGPQLTMLQAAKRLGADTFELFSNSPLWWMLYNHNPSGSNDGSSDNLQSWNHQSHARYMSTVAAHARDFWNVSFTSIELTNEPIATWWKATGTQEGCHFDAATQAAVLQLLPAELARVNLSGAIRIAASDESQVDMALSTWRALPDAARAVIDQVNVHGYQHGGDRAGLFDAVVTAGGKKLRDSEYGDGDGSGGTLVTSVLADWAALHPLGWCYWQIVDVAGGWGLLLGDVDAPATLTAVNTKHYVVAQFSRHIRPGMRVYATDDPRDATAAALDAVRGVLALVTANMAAAAADVVLDLSAFAAADAGPVSGAWITSTASGTPDPQAAYTPLAGLTVGADKALHVHLPPWSVVTVEVAGVKR